MGISVQEIIVDKLIKKIEEENKLPWQKPFKSASLNWYTKREYTGINKILLSGGEYMTMNQLREYNKKHDTGYFVQKGTKSDLVVFYTKYDKRISVSQAQELIAKGYGRSVISTDNGYIKRSWTLKYYNVFNINNIADKEGNKLTPHLGNGVIEEHTDAQEIVDIYCEAQGVQVNFGTGGAFYSQHTDSVTLPDMTYFAGQEAYYRVMFHELIHSTGVDWRLKRQCYADYHKEKKERSKEELVAEIGGLLLASEAGFREDTHWADNSLNYVAGWCSWMKDNKNDVINGMIAAEKAKNYILSGGVDASATGDSAIFDNDKSSSEGETAPDEPTPTVEGEKEPDNAVVESKKKPAVTVKGEFKGEIKPEPEKVTTSPKKAPAKRKSVVTTDRPKVKTIKSKKKAFEFFAEYLTPYYNKRLPQEDRDAVLDSVTAVELKHLHLLMTKEQAPSKAKKADILDSMMTLFNKITSTR